MDKLRKIRANLNQQNVSRELISEISTYILSLEQDIDYYKAIFDGSWPTAKEILQKHLSAIDPPMMDGHNA